MAIRIPWDKYETAILIDSSLKVINNIIDREVATQDISEKLRRKALKAGISIDSVYRNKNGISMQMNTVISLLKKESPSLYNVSKMFYDMVDMYHSEYDKFSRILKEAYILIGDELRYEHHFDKLYISNHEVDAVFFHKPDELHGYLSNLYYSPFDINGTHYISAEQYIMHQKCLMFGDMKSADEILATEYQDRFQNIGQQVKGYINSVWEGSRQLIALRGLNAKFTQNIELKEQLLLTKEAYLVECACSDKIWACGMQLNEPERFYANKWNGQNILGFTLMEVRNSLKNS